MIMAKQRQKFLILSIFIAQSICAMEHDQQLTPEMVKEIATTIINEQQKKNSSSIASWIPNKNVLFWGTVLITGGIIMRNRWWASPADLKKANQDANDDFSGKLKTFDQEFQEHLQKITGNLGTNTKKMEEFQQSINQFGNSLSHLEEQNKTFIASLKDKLKDESTHQVSSLGEFAKQKSKLLAQQKNNVQTFGEEAQSVLTSVNEQVGTHNGVVQQELKRTTEKLFQLIEKSKKHETFGNLNSGLLFVGDNNLQIGNKINNRQQGLQKISDSLETMKSQLYAEGSIKDDLIKKMIDQQEKSTFNSDYLDTYKKMSDLTQNLKQLSALVDSEQ